MHITLLKSKIHRASITEANLDYEGSITIPRNLAALADMNEFEKVLVANVANGNRFETYVMLGDTPGHICLNGAAAHLGQPGDKVIIMTWCQLAAENARNFKPRIVLVDERNQPKK